MSISWYLYCVDDAEALWLGKLVEAPATREPAVLHFYIRDVSDELLAFAIQKFLLLHRAHELRTVTEKFFARIEDDDHPIHFVEIPVLMEAALEPDPIDHEERPVPQSAFDRAREALARRTH